ncbi:hypothetical protein FA95DRAFT_787483 [Auriscalpium vulgare]|uniref:Uncharacterized protein n=1 Tax=Auriscalpium vulgare TaxID=40419 RepID=A0ACB8RAS9_9AGAM|nr:hypothetical protein FA95DRAFT_787483 [Auriscalpium vulgare]
MRMRPSFPGASRWIIVDGSFNVNSPCVLRCNCARCFGSRRAAVHGLSGYPVVLLFLCPCYMPPTICTRILTQKAGACPSINTTCACILVCNRKRSPSWPPRSLPRPSRPYPHVLFALYNAHRLRARKSRYIPMPVLGLHD